MLVKKVFENKRAIAKISVIIFSILSILLITGLVLAATHTSNADLQPGWSTPSVTNDYNVTISNTGGDSIDEIRIMQNNLYTELVCEKKDDWTLIFVENFPDPEYPVPIDMCWYFTDDIHAIPEESSEIFYFEAKAPTEDPKECELKWKFETRDVADYWTWIYDYTNIDSEPPITTKEYIGPYKVEGDLKWIDGITEVELTAKDMSENCGIGVDEIRYRVSGALADKFCEPANCENWMETLRPDMGPWNSYVNPFKIEEESCHVIEYSSVDLLGNEEEIKWQCVFVDKTAPLLNKNNGDAIEDSGESEFMTDENPEGVFHWLTTKMPVIFTCDDTKYATGEPVPHPSEDEELCFKVSYDYPDWGYITEDYCIEDDGRYMNDEGYCCVPVNTETKEYEFYFQEESMHNLEYYCIDAVEKKSEVHVQYYKVDDTAPTITKEIIGPPVGDCPPEPGTSDVCYIQDGVTEIHVDVKDGGDICAVGEVKCEWDYFWNDEWHGSGFQLEGPIIFYEDSTHILRIICEDALGNEIIDEETFLVDSTPPVTTKIYNPDPYIHQETKLEYIDTVHEVILKAEDAKVGVDEIRYRVSGALADKFCEQCGDWMQMIRPDMGPWNSYVNPFKIEEESCHVIEYSSVDLLGNEEEIKWQCVFVDKTAPETKKIYEPSPYIDENDYKYIDTAHQISLRATDPEPHPSGIKETQYRVSGALADKFCEQCGDWMQMIRPDMGPWNSYVNPFKIEEESCHVIEYRSIDNVGKIEDIKWQCVFVDKTAPVIKKTYEGPQYPNSITGDYPHYISSETDIIIDVTDPEPHPSGVAEIKYRVELVDDSACENKERCKQIQTGKNSWTAYEGAFNIQEDSCHLIEIYAEDNVGKSSTHKQCVFVDNKAPEIEKTITGPQIDAQGPIHKYITDESIIKLECIDIGPHPVKGETINWEMYWKEDNCEVDEGWQLIDKGEEEAYKEFTDLEDSCHKFVYWCEDALGNEQTKNIEIDIVDNQPPTPVKEVFEPKTIWYGEDSNFYPWIADRCWNGKGDQIDCWKVTLDTPISMTCTDPEPHPVNNEKICFQVELDGDDWTGGDKGYCNEYGGDMMEDGWCCLEHTIGDFYFLEPSEHNLKFYCEDALGNTNKENYDEEKFKVEGNDFVIKLNKKWNLISVPVVLLNDDPEEVFKDMSCVDSIWAYDPLEEMCNDEWCVYTPGDAPDSLKIIPGYGYWVLVKEECEDSELVIGGSLLSPGRTPPTRNLIPGWNLIGYFGFDGRKGYYGPDYDYDEDAKDSYCALYSLTSGEMGLPKWSSLYGYWETDVPQFEEYNMISSLNPGAGYWINLKDNQQEYIYSPSTICYNWFGGWFPI